VTATGAKTHHGSSRPSLVGPLAPGQGGLACLASVQGQSRPPAGRDRPRPQPRCATSPLPARSRRPRSHAVPAYMLGAGSMPPL